MTSGPPAQRVRFGVAAGARPLAGQSACGDACEVFVWSRGMGAMIVDGLGHGPSAATAAHAFTTSVHQNADEPLTTVFERAHHAMVKTRGAVAVVARFDEGSGVLEIAGLGNIGVLVLPAGEHRAERPVIATGVVGTSFRAVRPTVMPFRLGDLLIMHTDGVRSGFDFESVRHLAGPAIVERVLQLGARSSDDAACVVARGEAASMSMVPEPASAPADRYTMPILSRSDVDCAATEARRFAQDAGLAPRAQWEVSIATSELATNIVRHAGHGEIRLLLETEPRRALVVEAVDRGAGIPDVDAAMVDGFSRGEMRTPDSGQPPTQGLGVGLGAVRRLMDAVEIRSTPSGTRVVARKNV